MPHPWSTLENSIRNSSIKFKLPRTIVDRVFNKPFEENEQKRVAEEIWNVNLNGKRI